MNGKMEWIREPIVGTSGGRAFRAQEPQGCNDLEAGVSFQYLRNSKKGQDD